MSYGVCICSECNREVHQALRVSRRVWFHCDDRSELCQNAVAQRADSKAQIRGEYCLEDAMGEELPE
jgi:hypothetical protein